MISREIDFGEFSSLISEICVNIKIFSATHILREINFEEFRSSENAIIAILKALNF